METYIPILISSIIILSVSIILVFKIYKLKLDIDNRIKEKESQVALSFQRERIESRLYEINEELLSTKLRFEESNHLFSYEIPNIKLSENVIDDSFYDNLGINLNETHVEENFITCLMPFHKKYNNLYNTIKDTCHIAGFQCTRSDDTFVTGNILKYTIELILKSQIVVAVMDGRNPNVFYEIGIAHSIGKTVILVADYSRIGEIPFNLRTNRFIFYKNLFDLKEQLITGLNHIRNDRKGEEEINS